MSERFAAKTRFRVADLSQAAPFQFQIETSAAELAALATEIHVSALRKLRFEGQIKATGKRDWHVVGHLGATVVQPCIVTLDPVTTRIETDFDRIFLAEFRAPEEEEFEITDDENVEPLGDEIDLGAILVETLTLALPLYPRSKNADLAESQFTEPGKTAMTDEEAKPFAGLAALRDKLSSDDEK